MDDSKWQYIQQNWGLVLAVAEQWHKRVGRARSGGYNTTREELVSAALDLAVKCMKTFDPEKSVFSTYYYRAAQDPFRYVIFHQQAVKGHGRNKSLNDVIRDDADNAGKGAVHDETQDLVACMETPVDEQATSNITAQLLHEAIARLPEDLRRHAHETLQGEVRWKDLKETVELRRRMLKALKEELE